MEILIGQRWIGGLVSDASHSVSYLAYISPIAPSQRRLQTEYLPLLSSIH